MPLPNAPSFESWPQDFADVRGLRLAGLVGPRIGDHGAMAHTTPADTTPAVDAFIARLEHPAKTLVVQLRAAVLAADPAIAEGVKWNAPSFRTGEYFATMNLRAKVGVALVLHFGAKVRSVAAGPESIDDAGRLLKWLAKDRALVEFANEADLQARQEALQAVLRQWIRHV